ncbi:hypothetical protein MAP00_008784 [Monascus purpureus]|nr:hypothetical protein MAP00_008784 [Monascus purpureus]
MHRIHSWAKAHAFSRSLSAHKDHPSDNTPTSSRVPEDAPTPHNDAQVNRSTEGKLPQPSDPHRENNENAGEESPGLLVRMKNGSIRFVRHTKTALCHSWVNALLIFVPVGIAVKAADLNPSVIFAMNAVAIIPLAGLLSHATECVASRLGDTVGALTNVTFGNAVELIVFIIALVKDEIRIVQASLLGSILANLLLILGMAFLLGGLRFQEQFYNSTVTQISACLLSLSVSSLLLPTAFHASWSSDSKADKYTLKVSRGTSVVLLLVYILYVLFQLKSHSYLYASIPQQIIDEESHPGVLAEFMNSHSSDSSSSSDESDDSYASWSTAKRIKRAVKHKIRRKSSVSSKDTAPISSDGAELVCTTPAVGDGLPAQRDRNGTDITAIDFGDETAYHADDDIARPNRPGKGSTAAKRSKVSEKMKNFRNKENAKPETTNQTSPLPPAGGSMRPSLISYALRGRNSEHTPDITRRMSPLRPALPSLLSNTVFSHPPSSRSPSAGPGCRLHRSNSLPNFRSRAPPVGNAVHFACGADFMQPAAQVAAVEPPPLHPEADMSRTAAVVMLLVSTGLVAVCAEFLVDAIPPMIDTSNVSQAFIGLIILPIVSNAAEHVTAVTVATKNKMDLAIGVSVGSSIQIAIFITPLVVILGWFMDKDMSLYFTLFETVSLFVTAFVVNFLVLDGRSNYLEGALLIAAYIIIAVAAFYFPSNAEVSDVGG